MAKKSSVMGNVYDAGRQVWLAGLGMVAMADQECRGMFDRLVKEGTQFEKSDKNVVGQTVEKAADKLKDFGNQVEGAVRDTTSSVLHRVGIPTRDEIRTLIDRVERLTKKVEAR